MKSDAKHFANRHYNMPLKSRKAPSIASQIVVTRKDAPVSSAHDLPRSPCFFHFPGVMHTPAGVLMFFVQTNTQSAYVTNA